MNLNEIISGILDKSNNPDAGSHAQAVMDAIPDNELRNLLFTPLKMYLVSFSCGRRYAPVEDDDTPITPVTSTHPASPASPTSKTSGGGGRYIPPVNTRAQRINEAWKEKLRDRYIAADGSGKFLGELNYDDLMANAQRRYAAATTYNAHGAEWERRAELVKKHNVTKFSDLPEDLLKVAVRIQA